MAGNTGPAPEVAVARPRSTCRDDGAFRTYGNGRAFQLAAAAHTWTANAVAGGGLTVSPRCGLVAGRTVGAKP